jgi:hypothetical protein
MGCTWISDIDDKECIYSVAGKTFWIATILKTKKMAGY